MSVEAIEAALREHLAGFTALPKAWPNEDFDPKAPGNLPYVSCDLVKAATTDQTLAATAPEMVGRLIATVVVAKGSTSRPANRHADAIAALFPAGARFAAGTQMITITAPPHTREGMSDGAYWRVPVVIPFLAA